MISPEPQPPTAIDPSGIGFCAGRSRGKQQVLSSGSKSRKTPNNQQVFTRKGSGLIWKLRLKLGGVFASNTHTDADVTHWIVRAVRGTKNFSLCISVS